MAPISDPSSAARVQLSTTRLANPGRPGELASTDAMRVDAELSVAQEMALLSWLTEADGNDDDDGTVLGPDELAELRSRLAGLIERLRSLPADLGSVMLVGHNPGLHELAVLLMGSARESADELAWKIYWKMKKASVTERLSSQCHACVADDDHRAGHGWPRRVRR